MRVVAGLHHPAATTLIPRKGDGLGDVWLTGEELQFAVRRHLCALHAAFHAHGQLQRQWLRALFIIGYLWVFLAFLRIALLQEGFIAGFALGAELGEDRLAAQITAGFDDEVIAPGGQFLFGIIKPDRIAAQITHGIMQRTDGALLLALGIQIQYPDGAGGRGMG